MATEIKSVPCLSGKVAERFVENADKKYKNRRTVLFYGEMMVMRKIIKKAKLYKVCM